MTEQSKESTAEMLRHCIPLLRQHASDFSPTSYELWYRYLQGETGWLCSALDTVRNGNAVMTPQQTSDLHQRLVANADPALFEESRKAISAVVSQVAASTAVAQESTAQFGEHLDDARRSMESGDVEQGADRLIERVKAYSATLSTVNTKLQDSQAEVERLKVQLDSIRQESRADPLTGLANRRVFDESVSDQRLNTSELAVLLFDLDFFKKLNDTHGHLFGDQVIKAFASVLKADLAEDEVACRIGGEEFALVLRSGDRIAALKRAEGIRKTIGAAKIRKIGQAEPLGGVTVSCGVTFNVPGDTSTTLFDRADKALYRAKSEGRNRIVVGVPP